jgi:predicted small lipoprotein YifL
MKKVLMPILCALLLILSLAACGSKQTDDAAASAPPLPTPTAGTQITTFDCKVATKEGATIFRVDIYITTLKTTIFGETAASATPETAAIPATGSSPASSMATNVLVEVPANVVVTLTSGKTGKLSDIKTGNIVTMTKTGTVVTAITVVSKK